jgi:hypothetical protein
VRNGSGRPLRPLRRRHGAISGHFGGMNAQRKNEHFMDEKYLFLDKLTKFEKIVNL